MITCFQKKSFKALVLLIIGFLVTVSLPSFAHTSPHRAFTPTPKVCKKPTSVQVKWLTEEWDNFLPFVRVCPIINKQKETVMLVVSVWADLFYSGKPQGFVDVSMPLPLLFLPQGRLVGRLPMNYPDDPPNELVVTFGNWRRGFPEKIDLLVKSPTPSGDQVVPSLLWNTETRSYEREQ